MGVRDKQDGEGQQHSESRGSARAAGTWRVDGPVVLEALEELREQMTEALERLARLEAAATSREKAPGGSPARAAGAEAMPDWEEGEGAWRSVAQHLARWCRDLLAALAGRLRRRQRDP